MKALVIEDNPSWREVLCQELASIGIETETKLWTEAEMVLANSRPYQLVILDLTEGDHEPVPRADRFLRKLRKNEINANLPVIVVTGGPPKEQASRVVRNLFHDYHIFDYFEKRNFPASLKEFLESVQKIREESEPALKLVQRICERFHLIATELVRKRHAGRPTLVIEDEYDVQDLLRGLLHMYFDDIRPEEWNPSFANDSSRVDFILKEEQIFIEVKKTRKGLDERKLKMELIQDAAQYSTNPHCKTLVCFVYDPDRIISNVAGFKTDFVTLANPNLKIVPIVVPQL